MDKFFSKDITTTPFIMFSSIHLYTLLTIFILNAGLILIFKMYKSSPIVRSFRYFLAGFMLLNEISYIIWSICTGDWSYRYSLPLQLCEVITFLAAFMLFKENYLSFEILFFTVFSGGLQALLTPDLYYPFPHYRFFNFFISHCFLFTAVFYMIFIYDFKPVLSSIFKTLVALNIYMFILIPINILTKGNYMFLCSKPVDGSLLDFLGPWPWYLVSLEAVGVVIFFLLYLPFGICGLKNTTEVQI